MSLIVSKLGALANVFVEAWSFSAQIILTQLNVFYV